MFTRRYWIKIMENLITDKTEKEVYLDKDMQLPLHPVVYSEVKLKDHFWLPRLKTQKKRTLPFALEKTKAAVENLRKCGAFLNGDKSELPFPHRFVSSDLYKVMEGAACLLMLDKDDALEKEMDQIISVIEQAQQEDGYLYVAHICGVSVQEEMGKRPYDYVVHSHELYNMGHLYEGAVAYYLATGKRNWLDVAEKSAVHINQVFFEGDPNYNDGKPINQAPGHQEIEIGLCKLYSVTGNALYLNMARRFLDIRGVSYKMDPDGKGVMSPEYAQQHQPVSEQDSAIGHAVRAGYMYAGMADVGALLQEGVYDEALDRIWRNLIDTKMHITGGLGAIHGIEGFGDPYDLPNKEAYNETCAAIANVFFNYRMFLRHRDAAYFDVAEVALFNNALAGVNLAGDRFFYVNPLEADGNLLFNHGNAGRAPWFDCACCPSNIARLMPQVGGYMYASTESEIYFLLYGSNEVEIECMQQPVLIQQESNYPFEGGIKITLSMPADAAFDLKLRIPTWTGSQFLPGELYSYCDDQESAWTLKVNGARIAAPVEKGFAQVSRCWTDGDVIELNLPMPVRYSTCISEVQANMDRLAVTRGPLVYCAEEIDNATRIQRYVVSNPADAADIYTSSMDTKPLAGMTSIDIPASVLIDDQIEVSRLSLIPYFAWNNRGNASMNVWFPRTRELAEKAIDEATAYDVSKIGEISVSSCAAEGSVDAMIMGNRPQSSADESLPYWASLPEEGVEQFIEFKFYRANMVDSLGVYWVDDGADIGPPKKWKLSYLKGGEWHPFKLYVTDFFGVDTNRYVVVHPAAPLHCDGLRLEITPQELKAVGLFDIDLQVRQNV